MDEEQEPPLFQPFATAQTFLSSQEMDRQIADHAPLLSEGNLGFGDTNAAIGLDDWHTDFAGTRPFRKLSVSIQLSDPEDYEGGDLELLYGTEPQKLDRSRGALIVFPSFMLHRVTPVTRGARWSLVAWLLGKRWS